MSEYERLLKQASVRLHLLFLLERQFKQLEAVSKYVSLIMDD
jgi:hypothetical protein